MVPSLRSMLGREVILLVEKAEQATRTEGDENDVVAARKSAVLKDPRGLSIQRPSICLNSA